MMAVVATTARIGGLAALHGGGAGGAAVVLGPHRQRLAAYYLARDVVVHDRLSSGCG
jgi:hypothetical protein